MNPARHVALAGGSGLPSEGEVGDVGGPLDHCGPRRQGSPGRQGRRGGDACMRDEALGGTVSCCSISTKRSSRHKQTGTITTSLLF